MAQSNIIVTIQDCWTACVDEFPKPFEIVIVAGGVAIWTGSSWHTLTACEWPGKPIAWDVTHWMPIPKLPKP